MTGDGPSRLAAVMFDRDDDVDAAVSAFVAALRGRGARVAGFLQEHEGEHDVFVRDIESGERIKIMQDLGPGASGCRIDAAAIAVAAQRLGRALAEAPELLVVNRFGKLECDGGGTLTELGEAAAQGTPVVVCVPVRFRAEWDAFAHGLYAPLGPALAELEGWWAGIGCRDLTPA